MISPYSTSLGFNVNRPPLGSSKVDQNRGVHFGQQASSQSIQDLPNLPPEDLKFIQAFGLLNFKIFEQNGKPEEGRLNQFVHDFLDAIETTYGLNKRWYIGAQGEVSGPLGILGCMGKDQSIRSSIRTVFQILKTARGWTLSEEGENYFQYKNQYKNDSTLPQPFSEA